MQFILFLAMGIPLAGFRYFLAQKNRRPDADLFMSQLETLRDK